MNKITLASLCAVVLLAFSCRPPCHIELEKPTDIKPIDWDGYNDAYTVFWNIVSDDFHSGGTSTGDTIMVYGKIDTTTLDYSNFFTLMSEQEYEHNVIYDYMREWHYTAPSIRVFCYPVADELREKLASCDLSRRYYVKGELGIAHIGGRDGWGGADHCLFAAPDIHLYDVNDIYFETDKNENNE
jgi:hypothetical protein